MLTLNEINVCYGRVHVVKGVSLQVASGEICSVVGANGAGKSTLMNAISRILPLKSGSIVFLDQEITHHPPHAVVELGLVQIAEGRRLFPSLTVLENLELGAYQKKAKRKRRDSIEDVFNLFPILKQRESQLANTLSGGEQQILAIGRGLMSLPRLLMLDEPSLGLAPIIVKVVFNAIGEITQRGVTILLVEQNARKALSISDKGFVMENGAITMMGDAAEIANNDYTKKAFLGL